jgi:hypothetical protein
MYDKELKYKVKIVAFICVFFVCNSLFNYFVIERNGIATSSKKEMLSVPFQQTANYVRLYGDDVEKNEKEIIDSVLDYEQIGTIYNSSLADPVKETYKGDKLSQDEEKKVLKEYFGVWIHQFFKHPGVYFRTFISNTYDYYYPENKHVLNTSHVHMGNESFMEQYAGFINVYQSDSTGNLRELMNKFYYWQNNMPIIGIFACTGVYTWIYIIMMFLLLNAKKKKILGFLPVIVVILVCLVSPVNGTTRYMLPAMSVLPLMAVYTASELVEIDKNVNCMDKGE